MEKRWLFITIICLAFVSVAFSLNEFTGFASQGGPEGMAPPGMIGPTEEEKACMIPCVSEGCEPNDMECRIKNSGKCQAKCNAYKPEPADEGQACMESCVAVGCGMADFACQQTNKDKCEQECGMIKEPEAKSEEEACIRECVRKADPVLICRPGEGGEKGNEICQRCAAECVHLYAGPCLGEEKLEEQKKACVTCEHCYGAPVMGDSGEGYQCIVGVECKDASAEFGDNPGSGPGIEQESIVSRVSESVGNVVERVGNFFKGLFGIGDEAPEEQQAPAEAPSTENVPEAPAEALSAE
ncbi:MAG TPA: hypothetical protein HA362_04725 [Nanoarchaeota archaeon]|nr:hypothetical protein [Nanoarchaeota archaeon]